MRKLTGILAIYLCVGFSLGARSQSKSPESFVAAPGQSFYLDLDTAAGCFSEWRHEDLGSLNALSTTVRVPRVRSDRKWYPAFGIWLQEAGIGQGRRRVGVRLVAPQKKETLVIEILQDNKDDPASTDTLPIEVGLDEDVAIAMDWSTPNSITIKVGDHETRTVPVTWQVGGISITSSTGQVKLDPLLLGTNRTSQNR
jgi:hypothetical protein